MAPNSDKHEGEARRSGEEVVLRITSEFLDHGNAPAAPVVVVVLNWTLPAVTPHLLDKATLCICADGGANRLHDEVPKMFPDKNPDAVRSHYLPSLINGDLDSVRPDVLNFYSTHGVEVRDLSHDQMCTDLQKCITYVQDEMVPEASAPPEAGSSGVGGMALPTIVAVGAHGGRLDHILSNLSTLHTFKHLNIVLCGDGNLTRLVPAGKAFIQPFRAFEGPSCGLVPLQGAAVATTRGLRWNLDATRMEIGGLVSTSNIIDNDEIWVETDSDLIWTTELRSNPKPA